MKLNAYLSPKVLSDFLFYYDIKDVGYVINDDIFSLGKVKMEASTNAITFYLGNFNSIFTIDMKQMNEIEFSHNAVTFFSSKSKATLIIYIDDVSSFENKLRETGYID